MDSICLFVNILVSLCQQKEKKGQEATGGEGTDGWMDGWTEGGRHGVGDGLIEEWMNEEREREREKREGWAEVGGERVVYKLWPFSLLLISLCLSQSTSLLLWKTPEESTTNLQVRSWGWPVDSYKGGMTRRMKIDSGCPSSAMRWTATSREHRALEQRWAVISRCLLFSKTAEPRKSHISKESHA